MLWHSMSRPMPLMTFPHKYSVPTIFCVIFQLDECVDSYKRTRNEVQQRIELLKKNTAISCDNVRRYFREIRLTVDNAEKELANEVKRISEVKLNRLRSQCR